jgi:hypothetical protein
MNNENTSIEGYNIPFDLEICELALKQLKAQAGIHSRYLPKKSHQNKLDAVNRKRKQIAQHLHHAHGVSKDELYLNA